MVAGRSSRVPVATVAAFLAAAGAAPQTSVTPATPSPSPSAARDFVPPAPTRHFTDYASFVRESDASRLDEKLARFEARTGQQFLVVVFKEMAVLDPPAASLNDFTLRTANIWAAGSKGFDRGVGFLDENFATGQTLLRKECWEEVGGTDDALVDGFEDWEFWLRCARAGRWGACIPEYLDWYRRRPHHGDRWANWADAERVAAFRRQLEERYGDLIAELASGVTSEKRVPSAKVTAHASISPATTTHCV